MTFILNNRFSEDTKTMNSFFSLEKPKQGLYAVEKATLVYGAFTTLLILLFYTRLEAPMTMLLERMGILLMSGVLYFLYQLHPCRMTAFLRIVAQVALISYWYPETYTFNSFFPNLDYIFATWEQKIFGFQPALSFCEALPTTFWSEAFNMGYFSYYLMIFGVTLYYFFARYSKFEYAAFIVLASFFIYYLIYIFLPVVGPQFYFNAIGVDQAAAGIFPQVGDYFRHHTEMLSAPGDSDGLFYQLVGQSQAAGERPTAAFPSSHVGVSTILMILAYRADRRLPLYLFPFYLLLCCATVYIQAHYLIDVIAGFFSAFVIYYIAERFYKLIK